MIEPRSKSSCVVKQYSVIEYGGIWMSKNQMIGMASKEAHFSLGGLKNFLGMH